MHKLACVPSGNGNTCSVLILPLNMFMAKDVDSGAGWEAALRLWVGTRHGLQYNIEQYQQRHGDQAACQLVY